jgi:hypothetical protein
MYIGADEGCQDVPDPMAPIDIEFFSLNPTRIPMSSPFINTSGPMFILVPAVFISGIWLAVGDAVGEGIGIFI